MYEANKVCTLELRENTILLVSSLFPIRIVLCSSNTTVDAVSLLERVDDDGFEVIEGCLQGCLVRCIAIIVGEITAHPPDLAQFFLLSSCERLEIACVDKDLVVEIVVFWCIWIWM